MARQGLLGRQLWVSGEEQLWQDKSSSQKSGMRPLFLSKGSGQIMRLKQSLCDWLSSPRCQLSSDQLAVGSWSENRCKYAGIVHMYLHIFVHVGPWVHGLLFTCAHNCVCVLAHLHIQPHAVYYPYVCKRHLLVCVTCRGAHTEGTKESFVWVQSASDALEEM